MRLNKKAFPILSLDRSRNTINYKSSRLTIKYFKENRRVNSSIYLINDPNNYFDKSIMKICNFYVGSSYYKNRVARFEREIKALKLAKKSGCKNVVEIFHDDSIEIQGKHFRYYLMEKADYTLTELIETEKLDISEKTKICIQIMNGLHELHQLKIYHRDLKSDNILYVDNQWKICDLGLIDFVNEDYNFENIDKEAEKIGPFGWFSPEAMNKFFTEGDDRKLEFNYDCTIDNKSDVFQLGKLFWFIYQANIPIGQIEEVDFKINDKELFNIIKKMLQHKKERRPNLSILEKELEPIRKRLVA